MLPARRFQSKVIINGITYDDENIISIKFSENVNPGEDFTIGSVSAASVEISFGDLPNITLECAEIKPYISLDIGETFEEVPLGVFKVNEFKKVNRITNITCFDKMIELEDEYISNLIYPATVQAVANEIAQIAGVNFITILPNMAIDKIEKHSLREALSYVAMVVGGNARFNRLGDLEIIFYLDVPVSIMPDNYSDFEIAEHNFKVGGIVVAVNERTLAIGASDNDISFGCPVMTESILQEVYNKINGFEYMPYSLKWQGNPALQAGDKISITHRDGTVYSTIVTQQTIEYSGGLSSSMGAVGKSDLANTYNPDGPISKKINRIVTDLVETKELVAGKASIEEIQANIVNIVNASAESAKIGYAKIGILEAENFKAGSITADKLSVTSPNLVWDIDSFEQYPTGTPHGSSSLLSVCTISEETAYHGKKSLKTINSGANSYKYLNPEKTNNSGWLKLEKGNYLLSAYVKTTSVASVTVQIVPAVRQGKTMTLATVFGTIQNSGISIKDTDGWARVTARINITDLSQDPHLSFYVRTVTAAASTVYWDAIQLEYIGEDTHRIPSVFKANGGVYIDGGNITGGTITGALLKTANDTNYLHIRNQFIEIYDTGHKVMDIGYIERGTINEPGIKFYGGADFDYEEVASLGVGASGTLYFTGNMSFENQVSMYNGLVIGALSSTIGNSNINNAWLRLGNSLGMDGNEIYFSGTSGIIGTTSAHPLNLNTNGLVRMSIGADGRVKLGLGTNINEFSIDGTLGGNSDDAVPTEKAVKTYVDVGDAKQVSKTGDTMSGWITFDNAKGIYGKNTTGSAYNLVNLDASNNVSVGTTARPLRLNSAVTPIFNIGGTDRPAWHEGNNVFAHGTTGYQQFASGTIIQWGYHLMEGMTKDVGKSVDIMFPIAFPTMVRAIGTNVSSGVPWLCAAALTTTTKTGAVIYARRSDNTVNLGIHWIAIGY